MKVNKLPKQEDKRAQKKTPSCDMPLFRMTDPATGTTGLLKVKRNAKGEWEIPNPETRRLFFEPLLKSTEEEAEKVSPGDSLRTRAKKCLQEIRDYDKLLKHPND